MCWRCGWAGCCCKRVCVASHIPAEPGGCVGMRGAGPRGDALLLLWSGVEAVDGRLHSGAGGSCPGLSQGRGGPETLGAGDGVQEGDAQLLPGLRGGGGGWVSK